MSKRLILYDETQFSKYAGLYVLNSPNYNCSLYSINSLTDDQLKEVTSLGDGDAVMLVGSNSFSFLKQYFHFGIRNENFTDCTCLKRLAMDGGAFALCLLDLPTKEQVEYFFSDEITTHINYAENVEFRCLHTFDDAMAAIDMFDERPEDEQFGFDYETSGNALDYTFEISGASIATLDFVCFLSFTDIRFNLALSENTIEEREAKYKLFKDRLGKFLEKRMSNVWTYNQQYEYQVSMRCLGVDLYNLRDAGVINILCGKHLNKKMSLKWTGQYVLSADVWDAEFDRISDLVEKMLYVDTGDKKKKSLVRRQDDYKTTDEWKELISRYPAYEKEFETLIETYGWSQYMCIPSEILGHYCNLDAFYTLLLYDKTKHLFSKQAWDIFSDNLRLGCFLHSTGINKDEEFRKEYEAYCKKQLTWGIVYCATTRCYLKMCEHSKKMNKLEKYSPICQALLKNNTFFNGDSTKIVKYLLVENIDKMDASETGLDDGSLAVKYGIEFAEEFSNALKDVMTEIKFKGKIDESVERKKKLISLLTEKFEVISGLDKFTKKMVPVKPGSKDTRVSLGPAHEELEKYLYYLNGYNELKKLSDTQLNDMNNIPDSLHVFGKTWNNIQVLADEISDKYFKSLSAEENDKICLEFTLMFRHQTAWLFALTESVMQLTNNDKFYSSQNITNIEDGYNHFMTEWEKYYSGDVSYNYTYPDKMFDLALNVYKNLVPDSLKTIWGKFDGYKIQEKFFPNINSDLDYYCKPFEPGDVNDGFKFMRKLNLNYLLFKKYRKVLFTYIGTYDEKKEKNVGMFLGEDKYVIENPVTHTMLRDAKPGEPGAVNKMTARFQVMEKSSKRWSSGFHTIISHSDIKDVVRAYPGQLLTYFDISSAEVKSAGFQSGDPNLISMFENGIDVYIATAKLYYKNWDKMSKADQKTARKAFKTIFLGIMYGMGKKMLADRLNCTPEEAGNLIETVYKAYPKLREYIAKQQDFPLEHNGYVNTFFGDWLQPLEWKDYVAAQNSGRRHQIDTQTSKIQRLGVNLPIQGGTSEAMTSGFFNDIRVAKQQGWAITSFITVHDSNTGSIPCHKLWGIKKYYDKNFTDYCRKYTNIMLLFDLMVGSGYESACEFKQVSDDVVELSGTAHALQMIIDRMNEDSELVYETNIPREEIVPSYVTNPMSRFIKESGCSMVKDESKYTVQFKKLN